MGLLDGDNVSSNDELSFIKKTFPVSYTKSDKLFKDTDSRSLLNKLKQVGLEYKRVKLIKWYNSDGSMVD